MKTIRCLLLLALSLLSLQPARAGSLFEVESTYAGDGWFRYRVKTLGDPLFPIVDVASFGVPFTNRVEFGPEPSQWAADGTAAHRADWIFDSLDPQGQGYEVIFSARSSERTFRTLTAKVLGYGFVFNNGEAGAENVTGVGVAEFSVLVPCAPNLSDNSPTNRVSGFEPLPDLKIDRILATGGSIDGIAFSWVGDFTVSLQASTNLAQWRDVAHLFGSGASNVWTTNQPLNPMGNFFRLKLLGQGHLSPAP